MKTSLQKRQYKKGRAKVKNAARRGKKRLTLGNVSIQKNSLSSNLPLSRSGTRFDSFQQQYKSLQAHSPANIVATYSQPSTFLAGIREATTHQCQFHINKDKFVRKKGPRTGRFWKLPKSCTVWSRTESSKNQIWRPSSRRRTKCP